MGSFLGVHLSYNPFWEEPEHYANLSDMEKMYHQGYDDGYAEGSEYRERLMDLEEQNEALRGRLGAEIRVLEKSIRQRIEEEKNNEHQSN